MIDDVESEPNAVEPSLPLPRLVDADSDDCLLGLMLPDGSGALFQNLELEAGVGSGGGLLDLVFGVTSRSAGQLVAAAAIEVTMDLSIKFEFTTDEDRAVSVSVIQSRLEPLRAKIRQHADNVAGARQELVQIEQEMHRALSKVSNGALA